VRKTAVVLQVNTPETFLSELKSRGIREVRACSWYRRLPYFSFEVKRRFTAYDSASSMILRLDIVYYRGFINGEDDKRRVREAYEKIVKPVEERISRVAEILDGEYHSGEARW